MKRYFASLWVAFMAVTASILILMPPLEPTRANRVLRRMASVVDTMFTSNFGIWGSVAIVIGIGMIGVAALWPRNREIAGDALASTAPSFDQSPDPQPLDAHARRRFIGVAPVAQENDPIQAVHNLDAYATWQGGFDYYLAHEGDQREWNKAIAGLTALGFPVGADLLDRAKALQLRHLDAMEASDWAGEESDYLDAIDALNHQWRSLVPALHAALLDWRTARGLEEFSQGMN